MSKRDKKSRHKESISPQAIEDTKEDQEQPPKYVLESFSPKPEKQIKLSELLNMNGLSFHENVGGIQDINFTNAFK